MVFIKNILQSIVTIPVPSTSLRILFNILELETKIFDITSFGSLSKMVLSLLSSFTLMIRRLICSPNLLIANCLNSFAKTLVLSPWIDLLFSSSFLMHLHLILCFALFNVFFFVCFQFLLYFVFQKKKIEKYKNSVYFVYVGTCVLWIAIETKFFKLYIFCNLGEHLYVQLSKWVLWLMFLMNKTK